MRISDWSSDVCSSDLVGGDDVALVTRRHVCQPRAGGHVGESTRTIVPVKQPLRAVAELRAIEQEQVEIAVVVKVGQQDLHAPAARERGHVDPRQSTAVVRSEEHTSELQSLTRISYAVFCLKKKIQTQNNKHNNYN